MKTRWLSLEKSIERTLFAWDALKSYFRSTLGEKSDLGAREKRILDSMQNPLTKLYLLFLHSTLPVFNSFNVLLQTEASMVHILHSAMMNLYRDLLVRFVLPAVIAGAKSFLRLDYHDSSLQITDIS